MSFEQRPFERRAFPEHGEPLVERPFLSEKPQPVELDHSALFGPDGSVPLPDKKSLEDGSVEEPDN